MAHQGKIVNGFLKAQGTDIVNGAGERIILKGWGLGNWLLCEGYMWLSDGSSRFDRPRRIEAVIRELTGSEYSKNFWEKFRDRYITRDDVRYMAQLGYNSVRLPINWRILMEDEPGIIWKEDGFKLIDRFLDWCEEEDLYVFLDLHGAPGGQTGHNIDDSIDDMPRLFMDQDSWDKGIALWGELARRYKNREVVGGYDILNEPLRPGLTNEKNLDYLLPRLAKFYDEAIAEIRKYDTKHMISLEGHHWATDISVFYKVYDENSLIHFHRYACLPGLESFRPYLEISKRLNLPLWLGETGENIVEWYAAMYPLSVSLGIGYNLWTWKKMNCTNSPLSVKKPEGWEKIIAYTKGGPRPSYEEAQAIFDQYLENIKFENCVKNEAVNIHVFRHPGCRVRGTDFDLLPGKGITYSGIRNEGNIYGYQTETGMKIVPVSDTPMDKRFFFDCGWDQLTLEMEAGEFAVYSFEKIEEGCRLKLELSLSQNASLAIYQDDALLSEVKPNDSAQKQEVIVDRLNPSSASRFKVLVKNGVIRFDAISLLAAE
ncbi:MAG: glycoside hydrolase family 5 protein [Clostridiaceae bacterium]|nr:glycoside hydrolase family 5 protein [Clostridiaceae bacterium]